MLMQNRPWQRKFWLLAALAAVLAVPSAAGAYAMPKLQLKYTLDTDLAIAAEANWRHERIFEGIGWKLGSVSRGDSSVMNGGFTVIQPAKGKPFAWKNCYVLAAFDLLPRGVLAVTIRDPQYFWPGYDLEQAVIDPLELVWYDENWVEQYHTVLDYAADEYPDDFQLDPSAKYLLAIRHPLGLDGKPEPKGHSLNLIYLSDGSIVDVHLPDADAQGELPPAWWPVRMDWTPDGELAVQAGRQVRIYGIEW